MPYCNQLPAGLLGPGLVSISIPRCHVTWYCIRARYLYIWFCTVSEPYISTYGYVLYQSQISLHMVLYCIRARYLYIWFCTVSEPYISIMFCTVSEPDISIMFCTVSEPDISIYGSVLYQPYGAPLWAANELLLVLLCDELQSTILYVMISPSTSCSLPYCMSWSVPSTSCSLPYCMSWSVRVRAAVYHIVCHDQSEYELQSTILYVMISPSTSCSLPYCMSWSVRVRAAVYHIVCPDQSEYELQSTILYVMISPSTSCSLPYCMSWSVRVRAAVWRPGLPQPPVSHPAAAHVVRNVLPALLRLVYGGGGGGAGPSRGFRMGDGGGGGLG